MVELNILKEYKINGYITLKLEAFKRARHLEPEYKTIIYVNDVPFEICKYIILERIKGDDIIEYQEKVSNVILNFNGNSIDILAEKISKSYSNDPNNNNDSVILKIFPEEEFWAHCSNIEAWARNNYNTSLLHSNLSFPLLKKLTEVGDPIAKKVFKEEIAKRIEFGYLPVIQYLLDNHYLDYLEDDELKSLKIIENLLNIKMKELEKNEVSIINGLFLHLYKRFPLKFFEKINYSNFLGTLLLELCKLNDERAYIELNRKVTKNLRNGDQEVIDLFLNEGVLYYINEENLDILLSRKGRFELFFQYYKEGFDFERQLKELKITEGIFFRKVLLKTRVLEYPEKIKRFLGFIGFLFNHIKKGKQVFYFYNLEIFIKSKWFPLLILCVREGIIPDNLIRYYIPYIEFIIKKIRNFSINEIRTISYYKELANFERLFKYHNERIYPNEDLRELMEEIRKGFKYIIISDKMDYPSYLLAARHEWRNYVPKILNYYFRHIHNYENIHSFLIIKELTYAIDRILIRYKDGSFAEGIVELQWDILDQLHDHKRILRSCSICNKEYSYENVRFLDKNYHICYDCLSKKIYKKCSYCYNLTPIESMSKFEKSQFIFCPECMEKINNGDIQIRKKIFVDLKKQVGKVCLCGRKGYNFYWTYWLVNKTIRKTKEKKDFFCFYCKKSFQDQISNLKIEYKKSYGF